MKVHCIDCVFLIESKCTNTHKEAKNGYNNCKKFKQIPVKDLIKERNKLLISKENPERLEHLTEKIKHFNGGTI